jgi:carboxypeptidase Taq
VPEPDARYEELERRLAEISDLGRARALLAWDERTMMPPAGGEGRAEQVATLARVRHERLTSDRLWELLCDLGAWTGEELEPDDVRAATIRIARRDVERARRVPGDLRAEMARAASLGERAGERARAGDDLASFLPCLERNVALRRRYAECFGDAAHPYDALLDDFEPGLRTDQISLVLDGLREGLQPLVAVVAARPDAIDDRLWRGRVPPEVHRRVVRQVVGMLPLAEGTWRLDETTHPFATSISHGDLRLTTRYERDDLSFAFFSALHEAGHAIYEAGVPRELRRGPLGRPASLGFHESQSRLWENCVGRSRPFLEAVLPILREGLPGRFGGASAEELYRASNRAGPSPIRVDADEVTYDLHIALRFELELGLFGGELEVADLAEAWRERSREYLGIVPAGDGEGILQDVHWAAGSFGYFPTYSLGNVIAGQLWELVESELGDEIRPDRFGELREWLGERLHRHGGRYLPAELAERVLGGPLDPAPMLRRLERKYSELYGL